MTSPEALASSAAALVVGGGPAGMSAALYLARYNRSVLLFDTARGRSTHHQVNHNYLGFPDGVPIQRFRELGREQLSRYDEVRVLHHTVDRLSGSADGGFVAHTQHGRYGGQVLTNSHSSDISERFRRRLAAAGIPLVDDRIAEVQCAIGGRIQVVRTEDGAELPCEALFSIQGATPETRLAQQLGVKSSSPRAAGSMWTANRRPRYPGCTRPVTSRRCTRTR